MIKIEEPLYQWDTNRYVLLDEDSDVNFALVGADHCYTVASENCRAKIPNELLQEGADISVWRYKDDHTLEQEYFGVWQKPKPVDYVYTDDEVKTYDSIQQKVDTLETKISNIKPTIDDGSITANKIAEGVLVWDKVNNKPFESLGNGLTVSNGVLSAQSSSAGSAQAQNSKWELIEQINNSGDNAVAILFRKQTPSGEPYSIFRKLLVRMKGSYQETSVKYCFVNCYFTPSDKDSEVDFQTPFSSNLFEINGYLESSWSNAPIYSIDDEKVSHEVLRINDKNMNINGAPGFGKAVWFNNINSDSNLNPKFPIKFKELMISFNGSNYLTSYVKPNKGVLVEIWGLR